LQAGQRSTQHHETAARDEGGHFKIHGLMQRAEVDMVARGKVETARHAMPHKLHVVVFGAALRDRGVGNVQQA